MEKQSVQHQLTARRLVILFQQNDEDGDTQKNGIENTAGLAGRDHVDEQVGKNFGMAAHRVGQRLPRFDVVQNVADDLLQHLVFALLRQNVERLHERQTGVDHGGELTRENNDVARWNVTG